MNGLKERAFLLHLKECEFGYNGKKNLHQVLLEMRKICSSHVDPNIF
ncbi:hypothetical protein HPHPH9_1231 [Helicobacter pylori Hp H-9]|nr:hypothetical protein HPHPH9_1231 [Helicobacter pylori Hp H-9]